MKSLITSLTLIAISSGFAQDKNAVLMTIGNSKITVEEFSNVYHKNNTVATNKDNKSINEYVDLFVNYKLKVKEAEELGYDTLASFKKELAGYRKQLAQPYLTDKDVNDKLLKETYNRLKTDVNASHILVKCTPNDFPKDTLIAYKKALAIRDRIIKGEKFNKVASEKGVSDDPSAVDNAGELGYFTALQMVYPFETTAYTTKVNEVSMPVRTRFGYHIVKVNGTRPARGEVLVAHIMVKTTAPMSAEDSLANINKINEIYAKLKTGEKFDEMAKQYSDDKASGKKGGELPWFGTSTMPVEFEDASFALKNKGDYSKPIKTQYGWHIIKLLDSKSLGTFDEMKNELKIKVSKDSRSQVGRTSLVAKLKKEYGFVEVKKIRDDFYKVVDSTLFEGLWNNEKAEGLTKNMFNLQDKNYTQKDFTNYIFNHQSKRVKTDVKMVVDQLFEQFVSESVINYEDERLDKKYAEFKALMQEYRDGILLFELTDKKVWSKAIQDTTGAKEYYEKNKKNYMWGERAEAAIYNCVDEKTANTVQQLLKQNKTSKEILSEVNKESQLNLNVEERLFAKGENEDVDNNWNPAISPNITSATSTKVTIVAVSKLLAPTPKSFVDSKGMVISDYQNYLEKQWIEALKGKYSISIDEKTLATIK